MKRLCAAAAVLFAQIRLDATNIFNHPVPNSPSFDINGTTPFGFIQDKGNQRREFKGQLRLTF